MTDRLIYAALVAVWMAYLVPMGLRRLREVSGRGSIESFSSTMLALGGRAGSGGTESHSVSGGTPAGSPVAARPTPDPVASPLDRPSAREAAARRRRTLLVLLAVTGLTVVLVVTTSLLWPVVLVPVALITGFFVACRVQMSREEDAAWVRAAARQAGPARAARPAVRAEVARVPAEPVGDEPDDEDTVVLGADDAAQLRALLLAPAATGGGAHPAPVSAVLPATSAYVGGAHRVPVSGAAACSGAHPASVAAPAACNGAHPAPVPAPAAADGAHPAGSTWDPRPFTLPTYVTKPRGTRTVGAMDLRGRDTWTSGRVEGEQTVLEDGEDTPLEQRRAVSG